MMISAQAVKELREKTGAGMMECKKALAENGGDLEQALDWLRKQGLKASASKAARIATDGLVATFLSTDAKSAVLLELNCETDFVAKNEHVVAFAQATAKVVSEKNPAFAEEALGLKVPTGETIGENINLLVAKLGEKISLRRFASLQAKSGKIGSYIHLGSKIGVLVNLEGSKLDDAILRDVAMHVAAVNPAYLNKADIPADVLAREKAIYLEQMKDSGKPAPVLEKILEGKIAKYASEVCLNEQIFIKDPTGKKSVSQILKELDSSLKVVQFVRYQVGEGMEKKQEDFAAEVAKMVK